MSFRFNPPPGWPTPPEGWMPPPGWRPSPAWPPAPAGWPFYVEECPGYPDDIPPRQPETDLQLLRPEHHLPQRQGGRSWATRHKALIGAGATVLVLLGATAYGGNGSRTGTVTTVAVTSPGGQVGEPASEVTGTSSPSSAAPGPTPALTPSPVKSVATPKVSTTATARRPSSTRTRGAPSGPDSGVRSSANLCGAPPNPFGYAFCGDLRITRPAPEVCGYFPCIASFWEGQGYLVQCRDGLFSLSGGRREACSYHQGVRRSVFRS